ncbi:integrase [Gossypium australe]|uniref:Integrase n=1 Tax=Gossypium australe TaxID=47621 RepID=A0A5B6X077_9ROSI|nr:integrase [Gossypium australe]
MTVVYKLNEFNMSNSDSEFYIGTYDYLMFRNRICVPRNSELIQKILHEVHHSCLSVHLGRYIEVCIEISNLSASKS